MKINIIGTGKVGSAFVFALKSAGHEIISITDRNEKLCKKLSLKTGCQFFTKIDKVSVVNSELILICVQDTKLGGVIKELASFKKELKGKFLVHTSGPLSSELFHSIGSRSNCGSFHPIQTFNRISLKDEKLLNGITFGIEGGKECLRILKKITADLHSETVPVKARDKILYHTSCVIASNFLVCYVDIINDIIEHIGIEDKGAFRIFEPIIYQTLENVKKNGTGNSLTGPVARGDVETVRKQISKLKSPDKKTFYKVLSKKAAQITYKKGDIDKNTYDLFLKLLT